MTTGDLLALLRAGGIQANAAEEITRVAFHEFNAPKLAHLNRVWNEPTAPA
jgi:hypothetical protein